MMSPGCCWWPRSVSASPIDATSTVISTYGFDAECVAWQIVTLWPGFGFDASPTETPAVARPATPSAISAPAVAALFLMFVTLPLSQIDRRELSALSAAEAAQVPARPTRCRFHAWSGVGPRWRAEGPSRSRPPPGARADPAARAALPT